MPNILFNSEYKSINFQNLVNKNGVVRNTEPGLIKKVTILALCALAYLSSTLAAAQPCDGQVQQCPTYTGMEGLGIKEPVKLQETEILSPLEARKKEWYEVLVTLVNAYEKVSKKQKKIESLEQKIDALRDKIAKEESRQKAGYKRRVSKLSAELSPLEGSFHEAKFKVDALSKKIRRQCKLEQKLRDRIGEIKSNVENDKRVAGQELLAENRGDAGKYLQYPAFQGDPDSIYAYGLLFLDGKGGLVKDEFKARQYLELVAEKRHMPAITTLGYMLMHGLGGLRKDLTKAIANFRVGSENGVGSGSSALGLLHYVGVEGVSSDDLVVETYFKRAVDQEINQAKTSLDFLKSRPLIKLHLDEAGAKEYFRKELEAEVFSPYLDRLSADTLFTLYYVYGMSIEKRYMDKSYECLKLAADRGHYIARQFMELYGEKNHGFIYTVTSTPDSSGKGSCS